MKFDLTEKKPEPEKAFPLLARGKGSRALAIFFAPKNGFYLESTKFLKSAGDRISEYDSLARNFEVLPSGSTLTLTQE